MFKELICTLTMQMYDGRGEGALLARSLPPTDFLPLLFSRKITCVTRGMTGGFTFKQACMDGTCSGSSRSDLEDVCSESAH